MQFISLSSGSKGNCYCLSDEEGAFLIDCGISLKRLQHILSGYGVSSDKLQGIFITHEHRDHISGLGPLLRRYHIPCFGTEKTLEALDEGLIGKVDQSLFQPLLAEGNQLGSFEVHWARISHDAVDPVSYQVRWQDKKLGMITDAGVLSEENLSQLTDSDLLVVEANHDADMLRFGPYPERLKRRIAGDYGHLSNLACAEVLEKVITPRTKQVLLAHLSEKNNRPMTALQTVIDYLKRHRPAADKLNLRVAGQTESLLLNLSSM